MYSILTLLSGAATHEQVLDYGATHTTKLNSASAYIPVIFQQPSVGKSTPTSMAEPMSLAYALVPFEPMSDGAGASNRSPVTMISGSGSSVQTYPSRHQNTFCVYPSGL